MGWTEDGLAPACGRELGHGVQPVGRAPEGLCPLSIGTASLVPLLKTIHRLPSPTSTHRTQLQWAPAPQARMPQALQLVLPLCSQAQAHSTTLPLMISAFLLPVWVRGLPLIFKTHLTCP